MNESGKSDRPVVPPKHANMSFWDLKKLVERVKGRGLAKENEEHGTAGFRGFFDTLDHGWLMQFIGHRIADPRVLRHIQKWLNAGVLEEGKHTVPEEGTPQGGSISPLLANIYQPCRN